ncbi:hypothetical protein ACU4GH_04415 [Bradyrhizobium betae]
MDFREITRTRSGTDRVDRGAGRQRQFRHHCGEIALVESLAEQRDLQIVEQRHVN